MHSIIGAAFVVIQERITAIVDLVFRINGLRGKTKLEKKHILQIGQDYICNNCQITKIRAIDAIANYFKHHEQWKPDWSNYGIPTEDTIRTVREIGLQPSCKSNLDTAISKLDIADLSELACVVESWREKVCYSLSVPSEAPSSSISSE
jgi:hypothetical protein